MKAIITGGGTGGHIYPALAVARVLAGKGWEILYIGSQGGLEGRLVPVEGLSYKAVDVSPLPRKISLRLLSSLLKTTEGFFQARSLIKDFQPDIVLGTGGFVAGPVVLAASLLKIPTVIHEQNVYPGLTNRLLSYRVDRIALNFADAGRYFSGRVREKLRVTGNPIREIILQTTREQGLKALNLEDNKTTLLVFGGSQGSASINNAMVEVLKYFKDSPRLQAIHITGEANYQDFLKRCREQGIDLAKEVNYKIIPYLADMHFAYAVADLIVSRAGATAIAEITAKGIPAILAPYPYAAGNHQEYNARNLAEHGAAVVIEDRKLSGRLLIETLEELLNDDERLEEMKKNSLKLGQPEAREKLVSLIEELI